MKKWLLAVVASSMMLMLTGCSLSAPDLIKSVIENIFGLEMEETAESTAESTTTKSVSKTTTAVTTETTTTTTTTTTELTVPMKDLQLGDMAFKIDPEKWETVEEYNERLKQRGEAMTQEDLSYFTAPDMITYVLHNTDTTLTAYTDSYEGVEGFGTQEQYERYAEAMDYLMKNQGNAVTCKSKLLEKNGLTYVETTMTYASGAHSKMMSVLKNDVQYILMVTGERLVGDDDVYYELLETVTFAE